MAKARRRISNRKPALPVSFAAAPDLERVIERLREVGKSVDEALLRSAYDYAAEMHRDQWRRSGKPYLYHPLQVAAILADLQFDQTCVAVGLLHDVLEDTPATLAELESRFGEEIAHLVDGVTKIGRHEYVRRDDAQAETFRKLVLASAKDIRVILVKLGDRYHNMLTLEHLQPEARRRISQETLEIYAPIAQRLGMAKLQGDLEDLAFLHLYPHQFSALRKAVQDKLRVGKGDTARICSRLAEHLEAAGLEAEISSRVKRSYSIYRKLRRQGIDVSQLYDYLAFRIVTRDLRDCYATLGVVHQCWRPVPGRFKDYIAMPKPNLYQSLHTTLIGEKGQTFEVQIRTFDMDVVAEQGIAAHWRYKQSGPDGAGAVEDSQVPWLRQLLEWQQEVSDPRAFLNALKIDLYPDEVYVITPKGDVLAFPRGATSLDFAYKVHTELGHHCIGARINGKLEPLRTALRNGDMVEVLTSPSRLPSRDWLSLVKTTRAKSKIRHWLNTEQNKRSTEIGRRLLERELRRSKTSLKKLLDSKEIGAFLAGEGLSRIDDMYSRIGFGKLQPRQVVRRVLGVDGGAVEIADPGRLRKAVSRMLPFGSSPISVSGQGDLLAYLAKCCNPLPGDEIVGYVTRGRGVAVHSVDCGNVKQLLYNPEREIEVAWARSGDDVYAVTLVIQSEDQPGMLARLTDVIAKHDSNIRQIEADTEVSGRGLISVVVEVKNRKQLDKLCDGVRRVAGVLEVHRSMGPAARPDA